MRRGPSGDPFRHELERVGQRLCAERRDLGAELGRHRWVGLALLAIAVHLAVRAARAIVTPTFGWDDFTYHLYRAARWVQEGGVVLEPAPDAWTYYEFYPWGGDLVWAWTLVWGLGDALVPWAAIGVWAACLVTTYALARQLGQQPLVSLLVASALALMPAQITQIHTAYVDNAALFLVLAATLFLVVRHRIGAQSAALAGSRSDDVTSSLLLGMSCGLGVLVKTSFLPMAATAALLTLGFAAANRRLAPLVAFGAGASVAVPNLRLQLGPAGIPPLPVPHRRIPELQSSALRDTGEVRSGGPMASGSPRARDAIRRAAGLRSLPQPRMERRDPARRGSGGRTPDLPDAGRRRLPVLVHGRCRDHRAWQLFSPGNGSMLTLWAGTLGRLVVPSLAAWMVLAALVDEKPVRALLVATVVAEYFLRAPWKWPHEVWVPTLILAGWLISCAFALAFALRGSDGRLRFAWLAASLVFTVALATRLHSAHRYDVYRLLADGSLDGFDRAAPVDAWPAWRRLDTHSPVTIATAAGWDDLAGHNWFRYPLLGSRLQNRVLYVPISADGSILSYADRDALERAGRPPGVARAPGPGRGRLGARDQPSLDRERVDPRAPETYSRSTPLSPSGARSSRASIARISPRSWRRWTEESVRCAARRR